MDPSTFNLDRAPLNWFDGVVLVLLFVGLFRGRKRGMSEELLPLFQWLTVVVGSSLAYRKLGDLFAEFASVTTVFAYLFVYVSLSLVIVLAFVGLKRLVGEKLVGSDIFGRLEYYLGMFAGMLRYFCCILIGMALIHAPHYTEAEVKAAKEQQEDSLGSTFFPSFGQIQLMIMKESLTGHMVNQHLSTVLIESTSTAPPEEAKPETLGERRTRELERTINGRTTPPK